jgi:hypothetical protein
MSYKLSWYAQDEALYLSLKDNLTLDELKEINDHVTATLEESPGKVTLILDVSELMAGYTTVDTMRMTQHYRDHHKLETIIGIANNKLNRLITMLVFNLSRAFYVQFDSRDKARTYIAERHIVTPSRIVGSDYLN